MNKPLTFDEHNEVSNALIAAFTWLEHAASYESGSYRPEYVQKAQECRKACDLLNRMDLFAKLGSFKVIGGEL